VFEKFEPTYDSEIYQPTIEDIVEQVRRAMMGEARKLREFEFEPAKDASILIRSIEDIMELLPDQEREKIETRSEELKNQYLQSLDEK